MSTWSAEKSVARICVGVYRGTTSKDPSNDFLMHHGIKGQKWGVRRYQNEDGSLTEAGKERYGTRKDSGVTKYGKNVDSNKSSAAAMAARFAYHALTLNPLGLATDVARTAQAISAHGREKTRMKQISQSAVDEKTGLHLKAKSTTSEEDQRAINPGYKDFDTNTKNNCMLCTTAYEMRRRGYDVIANKTTTGFVDSKVKDWFPKAEIKKVSYLPKEDFDKMTPEERRKQLRRVTLKAQMGRNKELASATFDVLRKQGNGARGNLMIVYPTMSGHSVAYEVSGGQVTIRDCQTNKTYNERQYTNHGLARCISATYARTDNVDFDVKKIKEAVS